MEKDKETLSEELISDVEYLLREMSLLIKRKGREILNHFPITPPQFTALLWLNEEGDMTIGELSQKMYLACSTMTDLIDRMEKNGVVMRVRDERDRRVVRVRMLERGKVIIQDVMKARREYLAEILSTFSPEEVASIRRHLSMLYERMKE
ncbi:transcriptional regulator [Planifilum fulgidum]|mgnify:CR=1 FL=1|jgi:DNA-binding MarR family transcriptional regulator|uniref:Transcriptional regulator n=1 Tax=Planifilum fulgidum TaxID=201973 RepID=A0A1I2MFP1_9BACL|nr:MarR family transcriptional regulator [Planifilum fulgidum]MBO2495263.1 MarR family transcriptional regulator [Bacillota bacterium]SFF90292.1 transcriptional regulator [Planifilum fulgidum]